MLEEKKDSCLRNSFQSFYHLLYSCFSMTQTVIHLDLMGIRVLIKNIVVLVEFRQEVILHDWPTRD